MGKWRYKLHTLLTLAVDGGEWLASGTSYFIPGETAPSTHWIGGYMSPRVSLDAVAKRTIYLTVLRIEPGHAAHSPVSISTGLL
jgi:hypothetical protein